MKRTTLCLVFIFSMITSWLLFSIIWNFFDTEHTYVEVLRNPVQIIGLIALYWWCPGYFIIEDIVSN